MRALSRAGAGGRGRADRHRPAAAHQRARGPARRADAVVRRLAGRRHGSAGVLFRRALHHRRGRASADRRRPEAAETESACATSSPPRSCSRATSTPAAPRRKRRRPRWRTMTRPTSKPGFEPDLSVRIRWPAQLGLLSQVSRTFDTRVSKSRPVVDCRSTARLPGSKEVSVISKNYIDNYKCFIELRVSAGALQLLIGSNGSGKTAVFELPAFATNGFIVEGQTLVPPSRPAR